MIFAISAILLASNIISPLIPLTQSSADAFCKIGACLNSRQNDDGNGEWPVEIVTTVNNFCKSNLGGDVNAKTACTTLYNGINGKRLPTAAEKKLVSQQLNTFGDKYTSALLRQYGGLRDLRSDDAGQYCWDLYKDRNYGNRFACF